MVSESVLQTKQAQVEEILEVARSSNALVAAQYRGMSVSEMTKFRSEGRKAGVYIKIVKNRLARRALDECQYKGLTDHLKGPLVLCFSLEEPNAAAQLISSFMKECKVLKAHIIGLETKVLASDALEQVAKMPNKQQAIAMLLGVMQAPVRELACVFQETYAKMVRTVSEVAKVKQSQQ